MSNELLTQVEILEAINAGQIPAGTTGVECVPNKWVDGLDVVQGGSWADADGEALGKAFRFDSSGRDDWAAEVAAGN